MNNNTMIGWMLFAILSGFFLMNQRSNFLAEENRQLKYATNKIISEQTDKLNDLNLELDILNSAVRQEDKLKVRVSKVKESIKSRVDTLSELNTISFEVIVSSEKFDVEPALILAIIRQESAFDKKAVSRAGAQGLMQILPSTGEDIKKWLNKPYYNAFKISHNIEFGTYYISKLMHEYKFSINEAVMAYNGGPELMKKFLSGEISKLPSETVDYEKRVMKFYNDFKEGGIK